MTKTIVVKIGGVASDNLTESFFKQLRLWQAANHNVIVVHGGGHYVSEMMELLHQKVQKFNGLRVTDKETLNTTRMVLLGKVQPLIMTEFQQHDFAAVGLNAGSDSLIEGHVKDFEHLGFVGETDAINTTLLEELISRHHVPVVAPLGITTEGQWLNINADDVAYAIAQSMAADALYLMTDVPGVKVHEKWVSELSTTDVTNLIKQKVITGGMIPKLTGAQDAIEQGVKSVIITDNLSGKGTKITASKSIFMSEEVAI